MRLADLERVGKLKSERDYLGALASMARTGVRVAVGSHDLRPDLVTKLRPALSDMLAAEIERVNRDLAALGVTVDGGVD